MVQFIFGKNHYVFAVDSDLKGPGEKLSEFERQFKSLQKTVLPVCSYNLKEAYGSKKSKSPIYVEADQSIFTIPREKGYENTKAKKEFASSFKEFVVLQVQGVPLLFLDGDYSELPPMKMKMKSFGSLSLEGLDLPMGKRVQKVVKVKGEAKATSMIFVKLNQGGFLKLGRKPFVPSEKLELVLDETLNEAVDVASLNNSLFILNERNGTQQIQERKLEGPNLAKEDSGVRDLANILQSDDSFARVDSGKGFLVLLSKKMKVFVLGSINSELGTAFSLSQAPITQVFKDFLIKTLWVGSQNVFVESIQLNGPHLHAIGSNKHFQISDDPICQFYSEPELVLRNFKGVFIDRNMVIVSYPAVKKEEVDWRHSFLPHSLPTCPQKHELFKISSVNLPQQYQKYNRAEFNCQKCSKNCRSNNAQDIQCAFCGSCNVVYCLDCSQKRAYTLQSALELSKSHFRLSDFTKSLGPDDDKEVLYDFGARRMVRIEKDNQKEQKEFFENVKEGYVLSFLRCPAFIPKDLDFIKERMLGSFVFTKEKKECNRLVTKKLKKVFVEAKNLSLEKGRLEREIKRKTLEVETLELELKKEEEAKKNQPEENQSVPNEPNSIHSQSNNDPIQEKMESVEPPGKREKEEEKRAEGALKNQESDLKAKETCEDLIANFFDDMGADSSTEPLAPSPGQPAQPQTSANYEKSKKEFEVLHNKLIETIGQLDSKMRSLNSSYKPTSSKNAPKILLLKPLDLSSSFSHSFVDFLSLFFPKKSIEKVISDSEDSPSDSEDEISKPQKGPRPPSIMSFPGPKDGASQKSKVGLRGNIKITNWILKRFENSLRKEEKDILERIMAQPDLLKTLMQVIYPLEVPKTKTNLSPARKMSQLAMKNSKVKDAFENKMHLAVAFYQTVKRYLKIITTCLAESTIQNKLFKDQVRTLRSPLILKYFLWFLEGKSRCSFAKRHSAIEMTINRLQTVILKDKGKRDEEYVFGVFGQFMRTIQKVYKGIFQSSPRFSLEITFQSEGGNDGGGLKREFLKDLSFEIQSDFIDLLVPTQNHKRNIGENRHYWILNPHRNDEKQQVIASLKVSKEKKQTLFLFFVLFLHFNENKEDFE